jgi:hypothetical protein
MCLCRGNALCDEMVGEAIRAGYITVHFDEASEGRCKPCSYGLWTVKADGIGSHESASGLPSRSKLFGAVLPITSLFALTA